MNLLETIKNLFGMPKKVAQEKGIITITLIEPKHTPAYFEYKDSWNKVQQYEDGYIKVYECSPGRDWIMISMNRLDRADGVLIRTPCESTSNALHSMGITLDMLCEHHDILAIFEADRQTLLEATDRRLREEWCVPKD